MDNYKDNKNQGQYSITHKTVKIMTAICLCILSVIYTQQPSKTLAVSVNQYQGELHGFYPSYTVYSEQMKKYIDNLDSLSFAWSRIDSEYPDTLNTVMGKNGNYGFYQPSDFTLPVEYAKSKGKSIQINIYMDQSDGIALLPNKNNRTAMIGAIKDFLQTEIIQGKAIYYDGVVIDFEGLRNTDSRGKQLLYEGKSISTYFVQFLAELKAELSPLSKKLYVAVNPGLYYDGYDYSGILGVADRVILMAHDYEPIEKLQKQQVQQYTGYDTLEPINSMAPVPLINQALNEMADEATDASEMSKILLQITFDSAQWRFDVNSAKGWEGLSDDVLSREGRLTPLYKSIKDRVDNKDGKGQNLIYGYNNELQSPYLQYYNSADKSMNFILYEDSNSISAKIDLADAYGLGGISVWSLANIPDYTDANGLKYHLNGWTTILDKMARYGQLPENSRKAVDFADAGFEQAVRDKLGKQTGEVTVFDLKGIYRLKLPEGVKSMADLKHLPQLEYLEAKQLGIKDISSVGSLKNLHVLYLQRNKITDISALKKLKKLEVLSLNGNQVTSIKPLSSLTKLKELYLRENKISSIVSLSKLTKLEVLELGKNNISKIDELSNMKNLLQLSLDNNKIKDVKALKSLTGLEELYLQRNLISSINYLSGLKGIKLLSLNGNKIVDLKPLTKLTSLERLYLKENKISTVAPLKGLINLKELYLSGNSISSYSALKQIVQKTDLIRDFKIQ